MAGRKIYYFEPHKIVDVWDMDNARILMKGEHHAVKNGLVHLEYTDDMQKKFSTFEEFKYDQVLRSLKNLNDYLKECWINERQAEIDVKHHKTGAEADKALIDPGPFEERYKEAKKLYEQHRKSKPEVSIPEKEEAPVAVKTKRVYRRRVNSEQVANPN
jgi:hypothetical protein